MSNLLSQASLVMIPSGYKEDVVYSQIPTDGSGDLSFTRASNGTRVNSAGLVEVCPWNNWGGSDNFSSTYWTEYQLTPTTGTTSDIYGNSSTVYKLIGNVTNSYCFINRSSDGSQNTSFSVYAKPNGYTKIGISNRSSNAWNFVVDLVTKVVSNTYDPYTIILSVNVVDAIGDWKRIEVVVSTGVQYNLHPLPSNFNSTNFDNVTLNGTDGVWVMGAQVNVGTIKPYFPTTDRLNVPRLTYQNGGGGCPSLLLEKQSTNLFTYSEQMDNADWYKTNLTVTANATTSPDGTQNADLLDDGTASSTQHWIYQGTSFSNSTAYTISFYAKYVSRKYMAVNIYNGSTSQYVVYDIQNGSVYGSTGDVTASITSVGNGWYRVVYTRTMSASGSPNFRIAMADDSGSETYTGSNKQVYLWGCQCEASSYPTSYIPTTSSSATRVADLDTSAGSSGNFGTLTPTGTKAVLYWELQFHTGSVDENINIGGFRNGTTNQYGMYYWGTDANKNFGFNSWNGDSYGITGGDSLFDGQVHKIAGVFDFSNFTNNVLFIDGVKKTISQTRSTTIQRSANVVSLNSPDYSTQGNKCLLKEFVYFNQNLSDSELAALTTL